MDLPVEVAVFVQIVRDLAVAAAAVTGAILAWQRLGPAAQQATAAQDSAGAAGDQATLARRAYVTEQLRSAVLDLSSNELAVRLAAVHILREIARELPELATPVFEVLQGYMRELERSGAETTSPDVRAIIETLKLRIKTDDGP